MALRCRLADKHGSTFFGTGFYLENLLKRKFPSLSRHAYRKEKEKIILISKMSQYPPLTIFTVILLLYFITISFKEYINMGDNHDGV